MARSKRIQMFQNRLSDAKKFRDENVVKWDNYDEVYQGDSSIPSEIGEYLHSDLKVPWVWQTIESIKPRIADPEPVFDFLPVEPGDQQMSDILNVLIGQQLKADQFVIKQLDFIHDAMLYGFAVAKIIWRQRKKPARVSTGNVDESGQPVKEMKSRIVENRPEIVYVDPYDSFPDPAATGDLDRRWFIQRMWMTERDLRQLEEDGWYKGVGRIDFSEGDNDQRTRSSMESSTEAKARRGCDRVAVYEMYSDDATIMAMCGDVLLKDDPTPFDHLSIPFVTFGTQRNPRSQVAISECEKVSQIQNAIWIKDNQRIDSVNYANNYGIIMDPNIPEAEGFRMHPGKIVHAMAGQRFEQIRHDPNTGPFLEEINQYQLALQQVSGNSPLSAGLDPSAVNIDNSTATGANIMREEGDKRMLLKKLQFRLFEARIAKLFAQLNHQYLSASDIQRIVGSSLADGYKPIAPHEIPMFLDVIPNGMNESMSKAVQKNQSLEFLNVIKEFHGAPMGDGTYFDLKRGLQNTVRRFDEPHEAYFSENSPIPMEPPPGVAPDAPVDMGAEVSEPGAMETAL